MTYPVEVVERRGAYEKHFETAPGEFEVQVYPVPVHYEDVDGWRDIRPEWVREGRDLVLRGVPYEGRIRGRTVGADGLLLVDYEGTPDVRGHRVWWHAIAPDTSAVLIASAERLQLHLVLWGPNAPREWRFLGATEAGGRDNIERYVTREGPDEHYELDVRLDGDVKVWTGHVKAIDPVTRQKRLSDEVAYPARIT